jgi:hypothetical protein
MAYKDFPQKVYAPVPPIEGGLPNSFHLTMEDALQGSRGRRQVAEYTLNKVIEAKLAADICAEVG